MQNHRNGITKIELVVILVIFIFANVLLLPAIQHGREIARGYTCKNNLKSIGIALQNYHDVYQSLPPAGIWSYEGQNFDENGRFVRTPDTIKSTYSSWVQLLLPYLNEKEALNTYESSVPITDEKNKMHRELQLAQLTCPTDHYNKSDNKFELGLSDGETVHFSRGNYAINGGTQTGAVHPGYLAFPISNGNHFTYVPEEELFQFYGSGVAGYNKSWSYNDFINGRSTMVAMEEVRAGIMHKDQRGVWALAQIGSNATWSHGVNGDAYGPNCQIPNSDDILNGKDLFKKVNYDQFLQEKMPFCNHCSLSNQATSRSLHPGGVYVLMLDGAVKYISDKINPSLWHIIHSRKTPPQVFDNNPDNPWPPALHSPAVLSAPCAHWLCGRVF